MVRYGRNVQGVDCVMPPILLVSPFPPGCRIGPVGRVAQSVNIVLQLWESGLEFTVGEVNEEGGRGDEMKLKLERMRHANPITLGSSTAIFGDPSIFRDGTPQRMVIGC